MTQQVFYFRARYGELITDHKIFADNVQSAFNKLRQEKPHCRILAMTRETVTIQTPRPHYGYLRSRRPYRKRAFDRRLERE